MEKSPSRVRRAPRYAWLAALKAAPCVDCGKTFPACVMQYDHVRGVKKKDVALMIAGGWSLKTIAEEIAKCDLVCANCHAIRTWILRKKG